MKRKLPLFVMVGVTGVLVPVLAVLAQSSSTTCAPACCSQGSCLASKPSAPSSADAKVIDELIAILKDTKSEETFIVTAMALGRMGPDAKRALPQLVRGAERLGLLEDLFNSNAEAGDREISQQIAEAIMMLAESNKDVRPAGYGYATAGAPYSYGGYGAPTTSAPWNQPAVVPSTVPPCPPGSAIYSNPPSPGYASPPVNVPDPLVTPRPPSPSVKKAAPKQGKAPAPVPPTPIPTR
jgi:hypothetical protein